MIRLMQELWLRVRHTDESGFSTAELLGNAALGVLALVAIWALIGGDGGLGETVINYIEDQIIK